MQALKRARLKQRMCVTGCGSPSGGLHHLVPKGSQRGDDDERNLYGLCGDGSWGCHGALHGSPYWAQVVTAEGTTAELRDAEWVAARVGDYIRQRPDTVEYVLEKMGDEPGRAWLEERHGVVV